MTTGALKVIAIPGSLRAHSFNRGLLLAAQAHNPDEFTVEIYERTGALPIFNQDLEGDDLPQSVVDLTRRIREADAVIIATPEYNSSIPGGLKNLLDWGSRPHGNSAFTGKPVAVMGTSPSPYGAIRAQEMVASVVRAMGAGVLDRPLAVDRALEKFTGDGRLKDDATREAIADSLHGLRELARIPVAA